MNVKVSFLLTHPCITYQIQTPFRWNFVLLMGHHAPPMVTLFLSLTHVTCMALHQQRSSGTAPVLLTAHYATPVVTWLSTMSGEDLTEHFLLSDVFSLALFSAFSRLPWGDSSASKLARHHAHSPIPTIFLNQSHPQKIHIW